MTDLSSPQMQRIFKSVHRLNVSLYVVMVLIMLTGIGLGILMSTRFGDYYGGFDWAQITYIVMLGVTFLYALAVLGLNFWTRKPYRTTLVAFVAETYSAHEKTLCGGKNVEVSIYLIGDKITVAKQGEEDLIYFDISSVKNYYSVCAYISSLVKKYLWAYYWANAEKDGYYSVCIADAINKKSKVSKVIEGGKAVKDCSKNPFVKYGYLSAEDAEEKTAV